MEHPIPNSPSELTERQVIDVFWATFPPLWHHIRARIGQQAREEFNLTHDQFHVLRRIHLGRTNVSDLAEAKHISRPAASRAVDALVDKGLITRTQDPDDRRHVNLALTEEGESVLETIFGRISSWMLAQLSNLKEEELECIIAGMDALNRAFH